MAIEELPEEMEPGATIPEEAFEDDSPDESQVSSETEDPSADKQATAKKPVNLDEFEEFRNYKASRDRQLESERQQRLAYERQLADVRSQQQQHHVAALSAQLDNTFDAGQRQQLIEQIAAIRAGDYFGQWQRWNAYMQQEITERGLDPNDERFQKRYEGEAGAREFQADLLAAENAKLKSERDSLSKQVSGLPTQLKNMVQQELAKLAQDQGFNYHVADEPETVVSNSREQFQRDTQALNSGRMTPAEFARRYKGKA